MLGLRRSPQSRARPLTAALFFVAAIAMVGLPPLSGFVGKLLILDAAFATPQVVWVWAVSWATSLISLVGFAPRRHHAFLERRARPSRPQDADTEPGTRPTALSYVAVGGLMALLIALHVLRRAGDALHRRDRAHSSSHRARYLDRAGHAGQAFERPRQRRRTDMTTRIPLALPAPAS